MRSLKLDKIQQIFLSTPIVRLIAAAGSRPRPPISLSSPRRGGRPPRCRGRGTARRPAPCAPWPARAPPPPPRPRPRPAAPPRSPWPCSRSWWRQTPRTAPGPIRGDYCGHVTEAPPITAHLQPITGRLHLGPGCGVPHRGSVQIQTWGDILCRLEIGIIYSVSMFVLVLLASFFH